MVRRRSSPDEARFSHQGRGIVPKCRDEPTARAAIPRAIADSWQNGCSVRQVESACRPMQRMASVPQSMCRWKDSISSMTALTGKPVDCRNQFPRAAPNRIHRQNGAAATATGWRCMPIPRRDRRPSRRPTDPGGWRRSRIRRERRQRPPAAIQMYTEPGAFCSARQRCHCC